MTLTFDLTYDLDLGCFKVKFRYGSISGIVGLIDVKWKRSELIWYWADCMTFPFDHTHDLDPGVEISRSKSEIALSQEWDGQLTWNEQDVSHPFMTMILTSVTMMGWADVPDSDWGDFRRRRAVDLSSSSLVQVMVIWTNDCHHLASMRWTCVYHIQYFLFLLFPDLIRSLKYKYTLVDWVAWFNFFPIFQYFKFCWCFANLLCCWWCGWMIRIQRLHSVNENNPDL